MLPVQTLGDGFDQQIGFSQSTRIIIKICDVDQGCLIGIGEGRGVEFFQADL